MSKIAKWKIEFREQAEKLPNKILYYLMLDAQTPDDYDGMFTSRGAGELEIYLSVLEKRLQNWFESY